ncbi:hypothetical protein HJC23_000517 [Cyclotella cryptica]|uniref:Uncharacterized protein n=1 Tax=Cyclotella cryptica TaxID=29204 RepID=A0ABD3NZ53_9STRA
MQSDSDGLSTEPDSPVDNDYECGRDREEDEIPGGDSNADLHALLAYSKSRLEKQAVQQDPALPLGDDEPAEVTDDDEVEEAFECTDFNSAADHTVIHRADSAHDQLEIAKAKVKEAEAKAAADDEEMEALRIAEAKLRSAQAQAEADARIADAETRADPAHLLQLAEQKVKEAEKKARKDEEETGVAVLKPTVSTSKRSEANSELWALLNYSKVRLETGATPQLGKKTSSTRGDDVSVSSKGTKISVSSKASKRSSASGSKAPISVVGASSNSVKNEEESLEKVLGEQAPFPDVTGDDASVEGSVSGDDEQESLPNDSDREVDSDSEASEEEEEEEDELPSFLKDDDDEEEFDPAEAKRLYEEAKFKAASILSVSEEKLTDVQMLQAMAIAEEAAKNGDEKFSTKRSLFRLNEAKLEDLKSFLDFNVMNKGEAAAETTPEQKKEREHGWGIGKGRLMKKLGAAFQDLKERCDEIDERKQQERKGRPSNSQMINAAFDDLKKQIDEYERIVKSKK